MIFILLYNGSETLGGIFLENVKSLQYVLITSTCNEDIFVNQTINLSCDNKVVLYNVF